MKNPALLQKAQADELERALADYPSSGILQALYLRALKNQSNYLYPKQLKRTAVAVPNRTLLYNWVEGDESQLEVEEAKPKIEFKALENLQKRKQQEQIIEEKPQETPPAIEEKQSLEIPVVPEPIKTPPPVVQVPTVAPRSQDDLSHLPASVRETVLRARRLKEKFGDKSETAQPAHAQPTPAPEKVQEIVAEKAEEKTVVPAQPITPPAEEKVIETPLHEPIIAQPHLEVPAESIVPIEEGVVEELPSIEETIPEAIEKAEPETTEVTFDFTIDDLPNLEEPPKVAMDSGQKHSFIDWLQAPLNQEPETKQDKLPEQPAPVEELVEAPETIAPDLHFEISKDEPISPVSSPEVAQELLESFMEKPRIKFKAPTSEKNIEMADLSTSAQSDYITETLAQIYVRQQLYNRAINAYEILRLKYPEKSSLFAAQILEVKQLLKEKD